MTPAMSTRQVTNSRQFEFVAFHCAKSSLGRLCSNAVLNLQVFMNGTESRRGHAIAREIDPYALYRDRMASTNGDFCIKNAIVKLA